MLVIILYAMLLYAAQVWVIPLSLQLLSPGGVSYLFGNRSTPISFPNYINRITRAGLNIKESFALFLGLALLSLFLNIDNSLLAFYWLIARISHYIVYCLGIPYIRTIIWFFSIFFLIGMGLNLVG